MTFLILKVLVKNQYQNYYSIIPEKVLEPYEVFDKDFDDVGWDPIEEDDSDSDAADMFGYND